ncbi:MAG: DNA methyltransferase [Candidatus Korobacteraceae bacterium]|jgi:type II restriction/modification system DNA methylase subunit YeeA
MSLSLAEFVTRWKASSLSERSGAQQHFVELCEVLGQSHPSAVDQSGESFTFEKRVSTVEGDKGFADVWKKGYFAWEYKGKHHDLHTAYLQLLRYREDLENPPLLVVCDQERFEVHTNFPNTRKQIYSFTLSDLLRDAPTPTCALPPLDVLRALFEHPEELRPDAPSVRVTEKAATEFAKLATNLEVRKIDPEKAAHFLMRLLFCLFADSIGLLPDHLFRKMIEIDRGNPLNFNRKLRRLFAAMAKGDAFGADDVPFFNGGLFMDDSIIELSASDLAILRASSTLDWSRVEPAIFGTLFERSFDPSKRSMLGAHYTSKKDILTIIEPVVVAPLRKRWEEVKAKATALAEAAEKQPNGSGRNKLRKQLEETVNGWVEELSKVRVLDPACGSGNFLYLALRRMLDLWKEAQVFCAQHHLPSLLVHQVDPSQLYGIEKNVYAHELASVVVWIGYLQWLKENGMEQERQPVLRPLDNIQHRDAILDFDKKGHPVEPEWPETGFIIGNPPFLGGNKIREELGNDYVDKLFGLYEGRVPSFADLVCYWFERARKEIESGRCKRAGLLATQGIRGGANRVVLDRILETGGIFMAWSDRDWILDGANVHVSIIGFDDGSQAERTLDGVSAASIHANLTSEAETTSAAGLPENSGICFMGPSPKGPFDINRDVARSMLHAPLNVNHRPNSDVVRPVCSGVDIVRRPRGKWTIDFGVMPMADAALYEKPFEYLRQHAFPVRSNNRRAAYAERWWQYAEARPGMRQALNGKRRFIATPEVSKHRVFVWIDSGTLCNQQTLIFARDDDYFFGVLHSRIHEVWALHMGTALEDRPRYTPTSTFETFPFPWPPGKEPKDDLRVKAIADAACELVEKRDAWLNPPGTSEQECKDRTLTNLYNKRPSWLAEVHRKLDEAVFDAYGWPATLTDSEILERLLALNQERAAKSQKSVAG